MVKSNALERIQKKWIILKLRLENRLENRLSVFLKNTTIVTHQILLSINPKRNEIFTDTQKLYTNVYWHLICNSPNLGLSRCPLTSK